MILSKIKSKIFGKKTDRTKKYWENAANQDVEKTMWYICDGFNKETFDTKATGFVNILKKSELDNQIVMDLACGIGRTCKWISPQVKKYVGVDFIPEMIQKAKSYNSDFKNAEFHVNDGRTLENFQDKTFDLVFCELAFQHMLKPIQKSYIDDVFRILKSGGLFYAQIPRIEFYKDNTYARNRKETKELFSEFLIVELNESDAYLTIKAKKK